MRFVLLLIFMELSSLHLTLGGEPYSEGFKHFIMYVFVLASIMDIVDFFRGKN